uniref:Sorbitol dehydrogenase n=1 Tax=Bactrocera dorsalis TaxID=27457 RepID=A0A034VMY4_BACDO
MEKITYPQCCMPSKICDWNKHLYLKHFQDCTRSGGICTVTGMGAADIKFPLMEALTREVDLKGVFRYCNDYQSALELVATKNTGVKKLVTHHFDIEDTIEAFDTSRHRKGNAIKVLIHVQKRDKNNKKPFDK